MQLLRKLAFPFAFLYGLIVRIRNICYDTGILRSESFRTPVICIGNLSVGGTGKTPMVELLVEFFGPARRVAVLSRGYRRKTRGYVKAGPSSTAMEIGDEPFQLHLKYPALTVAVDASRRRGIALLEKTENPEIILLDDAFQHRKVRPDITILLTEYGNLYTDDYYLPTGNLRDSRGEAKRADLIVVTKCPHTLTATDQQRICGKLKPRPHQRLLFAGIEYNNQLGGGGITLRLDELGGRNITLVTGIASPGHLLGFLKETGITFEHLEFPDHHNFSGKEMRGFENREMVLTTEKDYRRMLNPSGNIYFIGMKHKLIGNGQDVLREQFKGL